MSSWSLYGPQGLETMAGNVTGDWLNGCIGMEYFYIVKMIQIYNANV